MIPLNAVTRLQRPLEFVEELFNYLEGDKVSDQWVAEVTKRRDKCPTILYRMVLLSEKTKLDIGKEIKLKSKPIISASDNRMNALYAGCSYHHDHGTRLTGKQIALVSIKNPHCFMSYRELKKLVKQNSYVVNRLNKEREYIIDGHNIKGTVLSIKSIHLISDELYKGFKLI
jgi:hypothetical protein